MTNAHDASILSSVSKELLLTKQPRLPCPHETDYYSLDHRLSEWSMTDLYSNNISLILGALMRTGSLARNELADLTGLTRTTVSAAVSGWPEKGVVREVEYGEASPAADASPYT